MIAVAEQVVIPVRGRGPAAALREVVVAIERIEHGLRARMVRECLRHRGRELREARRAHQQVAIVGRCAIEDFLREVREGRRRRFGAAGRRRQSEVGGGAHQHDAGRPAAAQRVEVAAVRGVDLVVHQGDYVAIMGPSGSGKSTLMHIIGCLDVPTSGSYWLAGVDVAGMGESDLAVVRNQRIGFVFQQFNLLTTMSAWRNVELPLIYAGVSRAERRRRAVEALTRVGLADRVDHRPGELSGGQQQRVSVARALVTEPDLILADEPTGNLDSTSTADVLELFSELNAQGRTIVLITHEHDVAEAARRMVVMRDGRLDEPMGARR